MKNDVVIMYEHPEWHEPLFEALERRKVRFDRIDLTSASYDENEKPDAPLYYNMVSPSAYKRNHQHAIPLAFALCRQIESQGIRVLNGSRSMLVEMSKSAQISLMRKLRIEHPRSIVFNSLTALSRHRQEIKYPSILKPEQGGSGARMYLVNSWQEIEEILTSDSSIWLPDNLLILQEKIDYDQAHGIIRMEYVGGEFLYAMRVVTHNTFNLCPSLICNPEDGDGHCEIPMERKPEFYPFEAYDSSIVDIGHAIMKAANHDSGSIEYCIDRTGKAIVYDINANSNLRIPIAEHFGIKAFERVVDFLKSSMEDVQKINHYSI